MWAVVKKKPLVRTLHATSSGSDPGEEEGVEGEGVGKGEGGVEGEGEGVEKGEGGAEGEGKEVGKGWVTAVAAFPNSDLVASGVLLSAVPNVSYFSAMCCVQIPLTDKLQYYVYT